jgi:hypothetical protein
MVIFHSYVKLPEGNDQIMIHPQVLKMWIPCEASQSPHAGRQAVITHTVGKQEQLRGCDARSNAGCVWKSLAMIYHD